jgi:replicative DNA helicase
MIAQAKNIQDRILDIKYGRVKEGLKIDIPEIDEYLRYKQGNFNVLIGHANVGKTTVIMYLFTIWAIKHKLRFVVWSSENTSQSIVRKIIEFKMGKTINKQVMN